MLVNDEEDIPDDFKFPENPFEFIGLALHSIQQMQAHSLWVGEYCVSAILMDQTCGEVFPDDILKTDHPDLPYQRLVDIINGNYKI
jgi:hypothetical protein